MFNFVTRFLPLLLASSVVGQETNPVVELSYTKYEGHYNASTGINYFRGIPYAQPPVNELRWRKPQPIEYDKTLKGRTMPAIDSGPRCYQAYPAEGENGAAAPAHESEDCLILDILVPAKPVSTALPVLVQIHGGGYTVGWAGQAPGDNLVQKSQGAAYRDNITSA